MTSTYSLGAARPSLMAAASREATTHRKQTTMLDPESTVTASWTGLAPERGIEYLVRRYTDRSMTVATRPSHSADQWGPEVGLRDAKPAGAVAGRCTCGFAGCSDAGWQR